MRSTIWKFTLPLHDLVAVEMPFGAIPLSVGTQDGRSLQVWAMVDPEQPKKRTRHFRIYGTGNPGPLDPIGFLGTVQQPPYVWHVFDAGWAK